METNKMETNKIRVSFDYDGTLTRKSIFKFARKLVTIGFDVYIVTSRWSGQNNTDIFIDDDEFTIRNGIPVIDSKASFCIKRCWEILEKIK